MRSGHARSGCIACVVGARPNYMKMAPLLRAFAAEPRLPEALLVHTGQHYDVDMNERLFRDLGLRPPDVNLEVGTGTHAVQTAEVMRRIEPVLDEHAPSCVVVVGDVNSTLAASLVAAKKGIPVVHVEAGLRSRDRTMPEEINRLLTDQLAALCYVTERGAIENLRREGVAPERIHLAGNVMIDSLDRHRAAAVDPAATLAAAGADPGLARRASGFAVATLHRPSNVDDAAALAESLAILADVAQAMPVIWPVHPRTRANLERFGLTARLQAAAVALLPPQGYLEMLGLLAGARVVLTDSGGLQEETTALGVPCLTMRENTERPVTVDEGTNLLVGRDRARAAAALADVVAGRGKRGRKPELWDGRAAGRIARHLADWLAERGVMRHEVPA